MEGRDVRAEPLVADEAVVEAVVEMLVRDVVEVVVGRLAAVVDVVWSNCEA